MNDETSSELLKLALDRIEKLEIDMLQIQDIVKDLFLDDIILMLEREDFGKIHYNPTKDCLVAGDSEFGYREADNDIKEVIDNYITSKKIILFASDELLQVFKNNQKVKEERNK